ncbi:hypothetical protein A2961_00165 [Candidatus Woesebacteria bacterium RIFCSPLOWO2_01_FULL_39_21]|uniref:Cytidyltransferase-like domain-containing protein n=1 Tax=Candidatus Woesebacteria bacterium RIFCSPLOWO2_01_FULL_39_21 TaxID=1802519 RepID=A0A1F8BJP8_9BACT|nr:MAG: hypothetical protein A2691_01045 [Candidatus Woesebacteria bacterium RIFCSPHIGHO2_01_FULL_39_23]OGM64291.1 MAG: hypothetical protein A2961_00165 [Candidatus Woesebacteria bacterium RIFCSPLOWO2_01_FULL_39_21]
MDPLKKIIKYKDIAYIRESAKKNKQKIVFLTGFFDLYHVGHASMLAWAKNKGDILFIGLGPDDAAKAWKGNGRPIYSEKDRAYILACHQSVDYVLILREPVTPDKVNFRRAFKMLSPDIILAVNSDKPEMQEIRRGMAKEVGANLILFSPFPHGRKIKPSTTQIASEIKRLKL